MKKLLIALITLVGLNSNAFEGSWNHLYLKAQNSYVRISFQKSMVVPTYGLLQGAIKANNLYIDLYGYKEIPSVKIINKELGENKEEFETQLMIENESHLYAKFNLPFGGMYIKANREITQIIELKFANHVERFEVNFIHAQMIR